MTEPGRFGRMEGGTHVLAMRVYWEDTDASGIVYYANYLRFVERARSDLLRLAGIKQQALLQERGLALTVRSCTVDYFRPARLDDEIEIRSRLTELRGATVHATQSVMRDGIELVRALVRIACIDRDGRARRLPAAIRDPLSALVQSPVEDANGE